MYVILKLKLIRGKAILFVNELERGYRLKLFLEKFGLRACVSQRRAAHQLAVQHRGGVQQGEVRLHRRYRRADRLSSQPEEDAAEDAEADAQDDEQAEDAADEGTGKKRKSTSEASASSKKSKNKRKKGKNASNEYGVSRGVDFVNVSCVINFDLPTSVDSYIHLGCPTARGGASGTALSFVVPSAEVVDRSTSPALRLGTTSRCSSSSRAPRPPAHRRASAGVELRFSSVSGFMYRVTDTLKSITKALIREARIKELKNEILTSTKLQSHFEDHPDDLAFLQHDKALLGTRAQQSHLKHVPSIWCRRSSTPVRS